MTRARFRRVFRTFGLSNTAHLHNSNSPGRFNRKGIATRLDTLKAMQDFRCVISTSREWERAVVEVWFGDDMVCVLTHEIETHFEVVLERL